MEIIFQEFCALVSTMAIKNTEYLYFGPDRVFRCFCLRLNHVEDNRNPILVAFSYCAHVCIGCERAYAAKCFIASFRVLEIRQCCALLLLIPLD